MQGPLRPPGPSVDGSRGPSADGPQLPHMGRGHGPGPGKIKEVSIARAQEGINSKGNMIDL